MRALRCGHTSTLTAALSVLAVTVVSSADRFHPGQRIYPLLPRKLRHGLTGTPLLSDPPDPHTFSCPSAVACGGGGWSGLSVTPRHFGADPTGRTDSTDAVLKALDVCLNASTVTPATFPVGARDGGGCTVDLDGGEYLISETLLIPAYVSNVRIGWGSLIANVGNRSSSWVPQEGASASMRRTAEDKAGAGDFADNKFLIVVGGDVPCKHMQGSCNEDIGFPGLFLDGSHVAGGIQVNNVMGTTIGPQTYLLNFTGHGIQINGGHEVMIDQTWLGETNFDFKYSPDRPPSATAIEINSNDHYILDSIVFSSLVGLDVRGAANMVSGLHVWFPWNEAMNFNATAFLDTGSQNRYSGCYIDGSRAVFQDPNLITWKNGFNLGGAGIEISGNVSNLEISGSEFVGGTIQFMGEAGQVVDTVIANNLFPWGGGKGSRASLSQESASPRGTFHFDFCNELVFADIIHVRASFVTAPGSNNAFPVVVARAPVGCKVQVDVQPPASGTLLVEVDTSTYANFR